MYKKRKKKKVWESFTLCQQTPRDEAEKLIIQTYKEANEELTPEQLEKSVNDFLSCKTYVNNKYQVAVYPPQVFGEGWPDMVHLSIKTLDKAPINNWSHLQRIKNELVGNEHEAVELFPAESRLVNMANQYHLWVLAEPGLKFPFGFHDGRRVQDQVKGATSKQRLVETGATNG